jgi:hypothetical protein
VLGRDTRRSGIVIRGFNQIATQMRTFADRLVYTLIKGGYSFEERLIQGG